MPSDAPFCPLRSLWLVDGRNEGAGERAQALSPLCVLLELEQGRTVCAHNWRESQEVRRGPCDAACERAAEAGRAPESLLAQIHKREQGTTAIKDELARSPHRLQTNGKELESLKAAIISRMGKFQDLMPPT